MNNILLYGSVKNDDVNNILNILNNILKFENNNIQIIASNDNIHETLYSCGKYFHAVYIDCINNISVSLNLLVNYITHDGCILIKKHKDTLFELYPLQKYINDKGFSISYYNYDYLVLKRSNIKKSLARIVLLCKNEVLVLEYFLEYYGYIFNFDNIMVVDNDSDEKMKSIYLKFIKQGIIFVREKSKFSEAVIFMCNYINFNTHFSEFIIPLETDEFICPYKYKENEDIKDTFRIFLENINDSVDIIIYKHIFDSRVEYDSENYKKYENKDFLIHISNFNNDQAQFMKMIFRSSSFINKIHTWCHSFHTKNNVSIYSNDFVMLHYTYINSKELYRRATEVYGFKNVNDDFCLNSVINNQLYNYYTNKGFCYHKSKFILQVHNRKLLKNLFIKKINRYPTNEEYEKLESLDINETTKNVEKYLENKKKSDKFVYDSEKEKLEWKIKLPDHNIKFDVLIKYIKKIRTKNV